LCACRCATDHHVLVVDKLTYAGNLDSLQPVKGHPRFTFVRADIADAAAIKAALADWHKSTCASAIRPARIWI